MNMKCLEYSGFLLMIIGLIILHNTFINMFRPPSIKYSDKMKNKSEVSLVNVLMADPAERGGMIEILESLTKYTTLDPKRGTQQSLTIFGDYGWFEMGMY